MNKDIKIPLVGGQNFNVLLPLWFSPFPFWPFTLCMSLVLAMFVLFIWFTFGFHWRGELRGRLLGIEGRLSRMGGSFPFAFQYWSKKHISMYVIVLKKDAYFYEYSNSYYGGLNAMSHFQVGITLRQQRFCLMLLCMLEAMRAGLAESGGQKPTELHRDHLADPH